MDNPFHLEYDSSYSTMTQFFSFKFFRAWTISATCCRSSCSKNGEEKKQFIWYFMTLTHTCLLAVVFIGLILLFRKFFTQPDVAQIFFIPTHLFFWYSQDSLIKLTNSVTFNSSIPTYFH